MVVLLCGCAMKARPSRHVSIVDFVNTFVAEPEDELTGAVADAWEKYLKHQPQEKNVTVKVDTKHGFMSYEQVFPESDGSITMQMCYWNCADGKHKLVAESVWSTNEGHVISGQYDGLSFLLYDNATKEYEVVSPEEYGLDIFYGIDSVESGYDALERAYYVVDDAGHKTFMAKDDYDEWFFNRPINTFTLPCEGKDILMVTHRGFKQTVTRWEWDGSRFNLKTDVK